MKALNELQLAKELIKFQSITPVDAGVMKYLEKKLKKFLLVYFPLSMYRKECFHLRLSYL